MTHSTQGTQGASVTTREINDLLALIDAEAACTTPVVAARAAHAEAVKATQKAERATATAKRARDRVTYLESNGVYLRAMAACDRAERACYDARMAECAARVAVRRAEADAGVTPSA